ncbi:MAG TPA: IS110 family transposase [Myxococcota bacterium]|nr:IS110 family transposase [Myxococcota bacterium]
MTATTRSFDPTALHDTLCIALELGEGRWKVGFARGFGGRVLRRQVIARDRSGLLAAITWAREKLALGESARVVSLYEAGRDGFWLHRFLVASGIENHVIDSSSLQVDRRKRRAKTDRLDLEGLLDLLHRHLAGSSRKVFSVVRVPTVEEEDRRHLHRELLSAKRDRTRVTNRMKGLLANQGLTLDLKKDVAAQLAALRQWDGSILPSGLRARLARELERVLFYDGLIDRLESARREQLRTSPDPVMRQVRQLNTLRGVGINSAWLYAMEFFGWRRFRNGKEVGALAGFAPTPFQSGESEREQGMSKTGNRHVRAMAIEIAWGWRRFQPRSVLTQWYERRFGHGSKRLRKIGIVALARKLLIALWRYLETGVPPEGALFKTEARIR